MGRDKSAEREPTTLAILQINGELKTVVAVSIPELRLKLRDYPASALVEVWRGRRMPLKTELRKEQP